MLSPEFEPYFLNQLIAMIVLKNVRIRDFHISPEMLLIERILEVIVERAQRTFGLDVLEFVLHSVPTTRKQTCCIFGEPKIHFDAAATQRIQWEPTMLRKQG